jgi:hypothetical protein
MVKQKTLTVIREQFDSAAALRRIEDLTQDVSASIEQKLYYPYYGFSANCTVRTMIGRKSLSIDCLVDGINGLGATADPFVTEEIAVADEMRLLSRISHDEAVRTAQRNLTHQLSKKLKMIAPFDVTLESNGTVYRGFWIVALSNGRIMIDSVTGGIHPLSASAA